MKISRIQSIWIMSLSLALLSGPAIGSDEEISIGSDSSAMTGSLTLDQAVETALETFPSISIAQLQELVIDEERRQTSARYFPSLTAVGSAGAAGTDNTRILAGGLNNPIIFSRAAVGLVVTQLITDFGRTARLVESVRARQKAARMESESARLELALQVGRAYLAVLEATSIHRAADQAVESRNLVVAQAKSLAERELKSGLDVAFASVMAREAELLRIQAENEMNGARVRLGTWLGGMDLSKAELVEPSIESIHSGDDASLIARALQSNPELRRARALADSADALARSEFARRLPTLQALGVAGLVPVRETRDPMIEEEYIAGAITLNLPLFAGGELKAGTRAARLRASRQNGIVDETELRLIEAIRVARLGLQNAIQRRDLAVIMVDTASQALQLARLRYEGGTSSMVERSQSEVAFTDAEIVLAGARLAVLDQHLTLRRLVGELPASVAPQ